MGTTHDDHHPHRYRSGALRVGIGGPVGSGKTELVACLCRAFETRGVSVAVVTNDIFTKEDAAILERRSVLPVERIVGVQTGCCPRSEEHTSELQSLMRISYAVFCLKKKKTMN